jgi:HPt (histidine-containing phosphotransfer) domain-containing protein
MTALVVETTALLESLNNDRELLNEVIGVFLAEYPRRLAELKTAVAAGDAKGIASSAHALRGSISTFGAKAAVEAAQRLESMGRRGEMGGVGEAFSVLERETALVASTLGRIARDASG